MDHLWYHALPHRQPRNTPIYGGRATRGGDTRICLDYVNHAFTRRGDRICCECGDRIFDCREDRICHDYNDHVITCRDRIYRDCGDRSLDCLGYRIGCDPGTDQVYFNHLDRVAGKAKVYIDSNYVSDGFTPRDHPQANRTRAGDNDSTPRVHGEGRAIITNTSTESSINF